jgi:hypothetical protein
LTAQVKVMAGMGIDRIELWQAPVGDATATYTTVPADQPLPAGEETFSSSYQLASPCVQGGSAEWLYYVRAFFKVSDPDPIDAQLTAINESAWSSPVWVTWSCP